MNLAKSIGIDAFALDIGEFSNLRLPADQMTRNPNVGKDSYNDQQLGFAYAAAAATGFKVFIR